MTATKTKTKERRGWMGEDDDDILHFDDDEDPGFLQPPGTTRGTTAVDSRSDSALGELIKIAAARGTRNRQELVQAAKRIGALLGAEVDPKGNCRAVYSWKAAGQLVEGPTIYLMDALAAEWGGLAKQVDILEEREDQVRLRARVIDMQVINLEERVHTHAIAAPKGRYAEDPEQRSRWMASELQKAVSKSIRTTLEHAMPRWFWGTAVTSAKAVFSKGVLRGKTLIEAKEAAGQSLLDDFGVTKEQAEAYLELPFELWALDELAKLRGLYGRLKSGETVVEELGGQAPTAGAKPPPSSDPIDDLVEDEPGDDEEGTADDRDGEPEAVDLRGEISAEIQQLTAQLKPAQVQAARDVSKVQVLRTDSPLERYEAFRDALLAEVHRADTDDDEDTPAAAAGNVEEPGDKVVTIAEVQAVMAELPVEVRKVATMAAGVPFQATTEMPMFDGCGQAKLAALYHEASVRLDALQGD